MNDPQNNGAERVCREGGLFYTNSLEEVARVFPEATPVATAARLNNTRKEGVYRQETGKGGFAVGIVGSCPNFKGEACQLLEPCGIPGAPVVK